MRYVGASWTNSPPLIADVTNFPAFSAANIVDRLVKQSLAGVDLGIRAAVTLSYPSSVLTMGNHEDTSLVSPRPGG